MVMATPSPQQVGREFVRQYYTVLHEAPELLHRFYSSGSMFVHGGVDRLGQSEEPVVGQLEIDKKIRQLSFKDCHTKIRQVDSQLTIGNGVVVQVTGELSNNGEAMRRFMQTFVLAPQSPKKFYVHNDIFRYQDEIYQDVSDTESEETAQQQEPQVDIKQTESSSEYFVAESEQVEPEPEHSEPVAQEQVELIEHVEPIEPSVEQVLHNGHLHSSSSSASSSENAEKEEEKPSAEAEQQLEEVKAQEVQEIVRQEPEPVKSNSWAKIIAKSDSIQAPIPVQNPPRPKETKQTKPMQQNGNVRPQQKPRPMEKKEEIKPVQPVEAKPQRQPIEKVNGNNNNNELDEIEKRFGRYSDGQQVFVGNLSQDITDSELRQFFSQYGKVLEVRINTNTKQPIGRRLPNYGFVVFEEKQHVDNLLGSTKSNNLVFKNEKGEFRLNVEEKRARQGRGYVGQNPKPRVTRSSSNGSRGNKKNYQDFSGRREEQVDSRKPNTYRRS